MSADCWCEHVDIGVGMQKVDHNPLCPVCNEPCTVCGTAGCDNPHEELTDKRCVIWRFHGGQHQGHCIADPAGPLMQAQVVFSACGSPEPCPLSGSRNCDGDHPNQRCPGCGEWGPPHPGGSCVLMTFGWEMGDVL